MPSIGSGEYARVTKMLRGWLADINIDLTESCWDVIDLFEFQFYWEFNAMEHNSHQVMTEAVAGVVVDKRAIAMCTPFGCDPSLISYRRTGINMSLAAALLSKTHANDVYWETVIDRTEKYISRSIADEISQRLRDFDSAVNSANGLLSRSLHLLVDPDHSS